MTKINRSLNIIAAGSNYSDVIWNAPIQITEYKTTFHEMRELMFDLVLQ